jgi:hypothetical protein
LVCQIPLIRPKGIGNIKMKEIITFNELTNNGKQIAFVKGNRIINAKNLKRKIESLNKYGNLIPIMYVEGTKAVKDGCSLVDVEGNDIEDASNYIVILDGQHRVMAAMQAEGLDVKSLMFFESYSNASTQEILAEANIASECWKGGNYISGAALFAPDNEIAKKANEIKDYPVSVISLILCWSSNQINKKQLSNIMKGKECKITGFDAKRADYYLSKADESNFSKGFTMKKYLINAVISLSSIYGYEKVCDAIVSISEEECTAIEKAKSDDKPSMLDNIIKAILTQSKAA